MLEGLFGYGVEAIVTDSYNYEKIIANKNGEIYNTDDIIGIK